MYKYALVLVDVAKLGAKTFSYLIPDDLKEVIKIGQPVKVPFGKTRKVKAYVVGFCNYLEDGIKAKYINEILETEPMFTLEYLKMLEWVANYYFSDLPTVLKTALPQKFFEKNVKNYRKPNKKSQIFDIEQSNDSASLSEEQEKVYKDIKSVNALTSLLYGITGSGKTEIYFKLIEDTIKEGKNVLFLAPEIALVSQLTMRTIKRFGADNVAIWHSSISEGEKYEVWQKLKNDEIKILFGARSSVFAPIQNLGLIIIDEEHDSSYKQSMPNPRYCAKEVVQKLAQLHGAKIVMGSATPDVVNFWRAKNSNSLFELKNRFNNAQLPKVVVIDMKTERQEGNLGIFSKTLIKNIEETIANKNQVILLINRRGFSSYTQCMECGEVLQCEKCAIPLIYHSQTNSYKCHYCGFELQGEITCRHCSSDNLENFGTGVQRVEEIAKKIFENATIARLDSDSLHKKNEHVQILNDFSQGKTDILIGTQMIAKGLDNPNVTLVGVINADLSFNLPDYRSSERGFSLLTQVAGRSGRGKNQGKVIFQTFNPQNISLQNAKEQNYLSFFDNEIQMREEFDYPPYAKIIRIITSSDNEFRAQKCALEIALHLGNYIKKLSLDERIILLGPSACVLEKIRGEYRFNIIIKNKLDERGHQTVLGFLRKMILPDDIKMIVDVDPSDIL